MVAGALTAALALPRPATADDVGTVALFAGGAASAFLVHEGCHAAANFAFGNTPTIERVDFLGVIPFFAVSPNISCSGGTCTKADGTRFGAGRPGLYTIIMGGIQCQHVEDEIILSTEPALRDRDAPFRKGMLAFNTLTSIAYVAANWAGAEPPAGDLRGTYRDTGAPRHLTNALVLGAAALDIARYLFPENAWLPWASRVVKVGVTGITFTL